MSSLSKGSVSGWLVLDKPLSLSSTQAGSRLKKIFSCKKIGHLGTLDPLATGVLICAFGEATKIIPFLNWTRKEYSFQVTWGEKRSTDDAEGDVIAVSSSRPSRKAIDDLLPKFVGSIFQIPPIFSAIQKDGQRAYDLARKGLHVDLEPRRVTIHALRCLESGEDAASFHVVCEKGTYVRALARDLAEALGTVGYVSALRRVRDGPFCESDAIALEKIKQIGHKSGDKHPLLPLEAVLDDIPVVLVEEEVAVGLQQGRSLPCVGDGGIVWVKTSSHPVGIAERKDGVLYPRRMVLNVIN